MLSELESQLNLLELKCRRPVEHLLAGEYRSVFRGRGVEFEDVRPYQPGDDVRSMDWKVTARTGEPHIKRYIEEREQFIYLLVDVSASMLHDADGRKRKTMAEVCALLTLAAVKNHDRIGLILFSDRIEQIVPPGKGRSHAMRIMDELMHFKPQGRGTDFTEMLGRFGHMARKHSIAFVVSDFMTDDYVQELQALAFRHDVNAINLSDSHLLDPQVTGLVRMQDSESDEQRIIDLGRGGGDMSAHSARLKQAMLESGVDLLDLPVGGDCVAALAGFFHQRQRRQVDETGG
tara:strand:+ start:1545 stop:2414 length:870 start_codon:yes stop_codon:yes gene_type:complete